jgi:hAT family C-terminal dimerisation region
VFLPSDSGSGSIQRLEPEQAELPRCLWCWLMRVAHTYPTPAIHQTLTCTVMDSSPSPSLAPAKRWSLAPRPSMPPSSDLVRTGGGERCMRILHKKSDPMPIAGTANIYQHWSEQGHLSTLQKMAYEHVSIPTMSTECERVFSDTKLTISPDHNCLREDVIEATEYAVQ